MTTATHRTGRKCNSGRPIRAGVASLSAKNVITMSADDLMAAGIGEYVIAKGCQATKTITLRPVRKDDPEATQVLQRKGRSVRAVSAANAMREAGIEIATATRHAVSVAPGCITINAAIDADVAPATETKAVRIESRDDEVVITCGAPPIPDHNVRRQCFRANPSSPPTETWRLAWQQRHVSAVSFAPAWRPIVRAAQELDRERRRIARTTKGQP